VSRGLRRRSRHSLAGYGLILAIRGYQRWISPALGSRCRFYPSCSEYAKTAIELHGALRGSWLALRRLAKCQPFHPGGIDHVPPPRQVIVRRPRYGEAVNVREVERGS